MGHNPLKFAFALGAALAGLALIVLILTDVVSGKRGFAGEDGEVGERGMPGNSTHLESFFVGWTGNLTTDEGVYVPLGDWVDVADNIACPQARADSFYQDLSSGVLDLTAGTFTIGTDGLYRVAFELLPQSFDEDLMARLVVNDSRYITTDFILDGDTGVRLHLRAGDVLHVEVAGIGDGAKMLTFADYFSYCYYAMTWSVCRER